MLLMLLLLLLSLLLLIMLLLLLLLLLMYFVVVVGLTYVKSVLNFIDVVVVDTKLAVLGVFISLLCLLL